MQSLWGIISSRVDLITNQQSCAKTVRLHSESTFGCAISWLYIQGMTLSRQPVYINYYSRIPCRELDRERKKSGMLLLRKLSLYSDWLASTSLKSLNETLFIEFPIFNVCLSDIEQDWDWKSPKTHSQIGTLKRSTEAGPSGYHRTTLVSWHALCW